MKTVSFSLHFGGEISLSIDQDLFVIEKNQILAIVTLIQCLKFQKICLDLLIKRWKIGFLQKFGVVIIAKIEES